MTDYLNRLKKRMVEMLLSKNILEVERKKLLSKKKITIEEVGCFISKVQVFNKLANDEMERDLLSKLRKTYNAPIKTDIFGKREALPSEIKAVVNPTTMEEGLAQFPPTSAVIKEKDEGLSPKNPSSR